MPVVVAGLSGSARRRPSRKGFVQETSIDQTSVNLDRTILEELPAEPERLGTGLVDKKVLQKDGSSRWVCVFVASILASIRRICNCTSY